MTQRLRTAGLALAILVLGLSLIVAVTEYEVGADAAGPRLLTISDVVEALAEQGVAIDPDSSPAHHPLLGIAGTTLTIGASAIEVYVYPNVAARVADEQTIQRHVMQLQALTADDELPLRVTSTRNVLLLYHAETAPLAASFHNAARALTQTSES